MSEYVGREAADLAEARPKGDRRLAGAYEWGRGSWRAAEQTSVSADPSKLGMRTAQRTAISVWASMVLTAILTTASVLALWPPDVDRTDQLMRRSSSAAVAPSQASQPDFRLQVVPATVYKVDDPGGARTSSFVFNTAVICSTDCELTPISGRVELFSAGSIVETQDWSTEMLAQIKRTSYRIEPNTPLASPTRAFTLPEAFDVRFYFRHPQALVIEMRATSATRRPHPMRSRWGNGTPLTEELAGCSGRFPQLVIPGLAARES